LGPVAAINLRQASRVANALHAGFPVRSFDDFDRSDATLVCVPDAKLPGVVSGLAGSGVDWTDRVVLLCEGDRGSEALRELSRLGAVVASLSPLPSMDRPRFLIEGDKNAVRAASVLVEEDGGRIVEVEPGNHAVCGASAALASWLCQPLMDASTECLRHAGLTQGAASALVERAVLQSLQSYLKGGRRACSPPSTLEERQRFLRQLDGVRRNDPQLAEFMELSAANALKKMGRSTRWLEVPTATPRRMAVSAGA
jgi:predicted short-subunit dehydrogenase-like oxidoreductase (DUF2520 family)